MSKYKNQDWNKIIAKWNTDPIIRMAQSCNGTWTAHVYLQCPTAILPQSPKILEIVYQKSEKVAIDAINQFMSLFICPIKIEVQYNRFYKTTQ